MTGLPRTLALVGAALAAVLSLISMSQRFRVEQSNRAFGLALEFSTVQAAAASEGESIEDALETLRQNGLTGVSLSETTVRDLLFVNRANLEPHPEGSLLRLPVGADTFEEALSARFRLHRDGDSLVISADPSVVVDASVGLDPKSAQSIRSAGLLLIARHVNNATAPERYGPTLLEASKRLGASYYLPEGDAVLGVPGPREALVDALERTGILYCSAEFAKTAGEATLLNLIPKRVIRLHAVQSAEASRMTGAALIERYVKAFRERNMRWLLVRPGSPTDEQPLATLAGTLRALQRNLEKANGVSRPPHPFEDPGVSPWLRRAIGLGTAVALAGLALRWVGWGRRIALGLAALCVPLSIVAPSYAALLGATMFPILAYEFVDSSDRPLRPWLAYAAMTLLSLVGGLVVAGTLNGVEYFVVAKQFQGVKIAHFLPVVLIAGLLVARRYDLRKLLATPLLLGGVLGGVAILLALAFMWSRTGNDNPASVSGLELRFRALLDLILWVRPRSKELLIGHPALMIGLGMLFLSKKASNQSIWRWSALPLAIGAIGQTSVVNTLCHLHTPLTIGLARIFLGWLLGGIIGWLGWRLLDRRVFALRAPAANS